MIFSSHFHVDSSLHVFPNLLLQLVVHVHFSTALRGRGKCISAHTGSANRVSSLIHVALVDIFILLSSLTKRVLGAGHEELDSGLASGRVIFSLAQVALVLLCFDFVTVAHLFFILFDVMFNEGIQSANLFLLMYEIKFNF